MTRQQLRWRKRWETNFRLSEQFVKKYGRMPFPKEVYEGVCLYRWLILEKSKYLSGTMPQDIVFRFAEIGIDIANFSSRPKSMAEKKRISRDEAFQEDFSVLMDFLKKYHRFPETNEFFENVTIGKLCEKWRKAYQKKQLGLKRIYQLNQIDFPWTATELRWRSRFLLLQKYVEEHKHLPAINESYQNVKLGNWLYRQRRLYRHQKLDSKHLALLKRLGVFSS